MSPNDPQEEPKKKRADSEKEVKRNRFLSMLGFFRRGKKKKDAAATPPTKKTEDAAPLAPNAALNTPSQLSASGAQARPEAKTPAPSPAPAKARPADTASEPEKAKTPTEATSTKHEIKPEKAVIPAAADTVGKETSPIKTEPSIVKAEVPAPLDKVNQEPVSTAEDKNSSAETDAPITDLPPTKENSPAPETAKTKATLVEAVVASVDAAVEADLADANVNTENTQSEAKAASPKVSGTGPSSTKSESADKAAPQPDDVTVAISSEEAQSEAKSAPEAVASDSQDKKVTAKEAADSDSEKPAGDSVEAKDEAEEPKHAPDIMANLEDLPRSYKSNRARLIMVDPERLFLHWNFSLAASLNQSVVMMFRRHFLGQPQVQETVPLGQQTVGTYYFVTEPGSFYDAVFGTVENGRFHELYQSNLVETPPVRPRYSEVAVWKVREAAPVVSTTPEQEEEPPASVWREPTRQEDEALAAVVTEAPAAQIFESLPRPVIAPTAPRPKIRLPERPPEPPLIEQAAPAQWVDSDYQPPHMALSNSEASPSFYSDPSFYKAPDESDGQLEDPQEHFDDTGFSETPSSIMGTEPQLPSVRWIGASEFILVGGPGSLLPALPGSQGASWNLHVSASEPVRRSS